MWVINFKSGKNTLKAAKIVWIYAAGIDARRLCHRFKLYQDARDRP